jgi:hypothetical protein
VQIALDVILWAAYNNVNLDDPRFDPCDDVLEDIEAAIPRVLPLEKEVREAVFLTVSSMARVTIS